MFNLLLGFFFILFKLDFGPPDGSVTIGLIPDWSGFLFLATGLKALKEESPYFAQARIYCMIMIGFSVLDYLLDLFGMFLLPLQAVVLLGKLLVIHIIIQGIRDLEAVHRRSLFGSRLRTLFIPLAVTMTLDLIFGRFPILQIFVFVAALLMAIVFMVAFNKTRKAYHTL